MYRRKKRNLLAGAVICLLFSFCNAKSPNADPIVPVIPKKNKPAPAQPDTATSTVTDTETITAMDKEIKYDLLGNYDRYQFKNDTLIQDVYINYVAPKQIKFLVKSTNRISAHQCEYAGVAKMEDGEGTAQGSDELNGLELYGVYEFFTKHPYFAIDIEFKRGKRMTLDTKDPIFSCERDCPLSSAGTLRRIRLSNATQHNPNW